jgi:penicillin-binding protein 1C
VLSDQDHHGLHLQDSVFDPQVATLIADVLSDPGARLLEFGRGSILELPTQTAVKTGTSSDHNDAWAVGFNHRFTVGVWMGNVDRRPMNGVTGATGPGLVLRSVFAELEPRLQPEPLRLDPRLLSVEVCEESGELAGEFCPAVSEWLRASDREKKRSCPIHGDETLVQRYAQAENSRGVLPEGLGKGPAVAKDAWISPGPGLHLALDPRIPDSLESYRFEVEPAAGADFEVEWQLDGQFLARTDQPHYDWPVVAGEHSLVAVVVRAGRRQALAPVRFEVL